MRLKGVAVQSHDGKDTTSLCNIFADGLIAAVIESALRQYDCHTPARLQEVKVAFYEKNITADTFCALPFFIPKSYRLKNLALLNLSGEGWICHQNRKVELPEIVADA